MKSKIQGKAAHYVYRARLVFALLQLLVSGGDLFAEQGSGKGRVVQLNSQGVLIDFLKTDPTFEDEPSVAGKEEQIVLDAEAKAKVALLNDISQRKLFVKPQFRPEQNGGKLHPQVMVDHFFKYVQKDERFRREDGFNTLWEHDGFTYISHYWTSIPMQGASSGYQGFWHWGAGFGRARYELSAAAVRLKSKINSCSAEKLALPSEFYTILSILASSDMRFVTYDGYFHGEKVSAEIDSKEIAAVFDDEVFGTIISRPVWNGAREQSQYGILSHVLFDNLLSAFSYLDSHFQNDGIASELVSALNLCDAWQLSDETRSKLEKIFNTASQIQKSLSDERNVASVIDQAKLANDPKSLGGILISMGLDQMMVDQFSKNQLRLMGDIIDEEKVRIKDEISDLSDGMLGIGLMILIYSSEENAVPQDTPVIGKAWLKDAINETKIDQDKLRNTLKDFEAFAKLVRDNLTQSSKRKSYWTQLERVLMSYSDMDMIRDWSEGDSNYALQGTKFLRPDLHSDLYGSDVHDYLSKNYGLESAGVDPSTFPVRY